MHADSSISPATKERSAADRETLTVAITTKDAGHLLKDCLESVAFADEIIVVDMFSVDDTEAVCAVHPQCRLIQHQGYMQENLNIAFDEATSDWVMRIDTDERLTPELASEIQEILAQRDQSVTGYEFWERIFILGHELQHGFGRKHFRKFMFRRGKARFPVEHDHDDLATSGLWLRGQHGYLHYNYAAVRDYLVKMNYYTDNDSKRAELPEHAPPVVTMPKEAARAFYLYYLKYQGFRDGWIGFLDAGMRGVYQFVYHAKVRERWERERKAST
jgi:glycosyltransferase involved in cell wall biosynthesis